MRRIQRQILRAQGLMYRRGRYLRSWCPAIVGSEKNPSTPGPKLRALRKSISRITGKARVRFHRKHRREEKARIAMIAAGGAL